MVASFDLYDILAKLVPGGFLLCGLALIAQNIGLRVQWLVQLTSGTETVAFILTAYIVGVVTDTLGEWMPDWAFCFRRQTPPRGYLAGDFPDEAAEKVFAIREAVQQGLLGTRIPFGEDREENLASSEFAFRLALAAVSDDSPKVRGLEAQYALHRSLTVANLILLVVSFVGACRAPVPLCAFMACSACLAALFLRETYTRHFYFVRDVFEIAFEKLKTPHPRLAALPHGLLP